MGGNRAFAGRGEDGVVAVRVEGPQLISSALCGFKRYRCCRTCNGKCELAMLTRNLKGMTVDPTSTAILN